MQEMPHLHRKSHLSQEFLGKNQKPLVYGMLVDVSPCGDVASPALLHREMRNLPHELQPKNRKKDFIGRCQEIYFLHLPAVLQLLRFPGYVTLLLSDIGFAPSLAEFSAFRKLMDS